VLACLPETTPMRAQIGMELRGHIDERLAGGQPLARILAQLGDPPQLAASYVAAVPLVSASFGKRAVAKLLDVVTVVAITCTIVGAAVLLLARDGDRAGALLMFGPVLI